VGKRSFLVLLIVMALLGFFFQTFATQRGIGLSDDSVSYMWAARNLDRGVGLVWDDGHGGFTPMIWWPPLYPSLLAAAGLSGADFQAAARVLGGLLFAGSILVVGLTFYAYSARNARLAAFAALLVLISPVMIEIYAMAWSEPLALSLGFLAIYLTARYLDDSKRPGLLAAAAVSGLAFLTRYPGAAFIGAALLGICFLTQASWKRRISDAFLFGAISCLPTALWLARNFHATGSLTGRAFCVHPVTRKQLAEILSVFSRWVVPDLRPGVTLLHNPVRMANLLLAAAGLALACYLAFRRKTAGAVKEDAPGRLRFLPHLLVGYAVLYGALLAMTLSFFDAQTEADIRTLCPLYAAFLLLVLCAMNWVRPALNGRRALATAAMCLCAVLSLFYLAGAVRWAGEAARQGAGFNGRAWQASGVAAEIRKLPPEAALYTNATRAVYIMADRVSCDAPRKYDPITLKPNTRFAAEMAAMAQRIEERGGAVASFAYFRERPEARLFPSDAELKAALPGALVRQESDGRIYRLEARPREVRTTKGE
jgi:hypothetical protein